MNGVCIELNEMEWNIIERIIEHSNHVEIRRISIQHQINSNNLM